MFGLREVHVIEGDDEYLCNYCYGGKRSGRLKRQIDHYTIYNSL